MNREDLTAALDAIEARANTETTHEYGGVQTDRDYLLVLSRQLIAEVEA